jgi:hypothetical protein
MCKILYYLDMFIKKEGKITDLVVIGLNDLVQAAL